MLDIPFENSLFRFTRIDGNGLSKDSAYRLLLDMQGVIR